MLGIVPLTVTQTTGKVAVEHVPALPPSTMLVHDGPHGDDPGQESYWSTLTVMPEATLPACEVTKLVTDALAVSSIFPQASRWPTCSTEAALAPAAVACVTRWSARKV